MIDFKKPLTLDRIVRIAATLAICWGLVLLARYLSDVLIPFAIAILLAYLLNPFMRFVQKFIRKRGAAVMTGLFLISLVIIAVGWLIVPVMYNEFRHIGQIISGIINDPQLSNRLSQSLPANLWIDIEQFLKSDEVKSVFSSDSMIGLLGKFGENILPGIWSLISGTTTFIITIIGVVVIFMYLVFILIDYDKFSGNWKNLIPGSYRHFISELVEDFFEAMNVYFRSQALIALIIAILFSTAFSIIGMPMAIGLGIFIGLLSMVPYLHILGTIPAFFLGFLHAIETGQNIWFYLGIVALIFIIIQQIEDWILTPRIMGKVTGMNPALIILSISIWGKLLGFFGLLIALPLTFLLIAYYRRFINHTERTPGTILFPPEHHENC